MDAPSFEEIQHVLESHDSDIVSRMNALYQARAIGGQWASDLLVKCLLELRHPSVLFRHEVAYTLGQLGKTSAIPALTKLLLDDTENCMVRHEAGESLAAIGSVESLPILEGLLDSPSVSVRQTCEVAVESIKRKQRGEPKNKSKKNLFNTVDPIEGDWSDTATKEDVLHQRTILLDQTRPLRERYEALFTLRNMTLVPRLDAEAPIIESLDTDQTSPLFRHEVAFVLGQILTPKSLKVLTKILESPNEHPMARHEAAYAIASVMTAPMENEEYREARDAAVASLRRHAVADPEPIVFESCVVAIADCC